MNYKCGTFDCQKSHTCVPTVRLLALFRMTFVPQKCHFWRSSVPRKTFSRRFSHKKASKSAVFFSRTAENSYSELGELGSWGVGELGSGGVGDDGHAAVWRPVSIFCWMAVWKRMRKSTRQIWLLAFFFVLLQRQSERPRPRGATASADATLARGAPHGHPTGRKTVTTQP